MYILSNKSTQSSIRKYSQHISTTPSSFRTHLCRHCVWLARRLLLRNHFLHSLPQIGRHFVKHSDLTLLNEIFRSTQMSRNVIHCLRFVFIRHNLPQRTWLSIIVLILPFLGEPSRYFASFDAV